MQMLVGRVIRQATVPAFPDSFFGDRLTISQFDFS